MDWPRSDCPLSCSLPQPVEASHASECGLVVSKQKHGFAIKLAWAARVKSTSSSAAYVGFYMQVDVSYARALISCLREPDFFL